MEWNFELYSLLLFYCVPVALIIARILWQRRAQRGALFLSLLMAAVAEWSLPFGLQSAIVDVAPKMVFVRLSYLGITVSPALVFLFALEYSQRRNWLKGWRIGLLFLIPILYVFLVFTNDQHFLVWDSSVTITENNQIVFHYGPAFWVMLIYFYLLLAISSFLLVEAAIQIHPLYQQQSQAIVLGLIFPILANVLYVTKWSPLYGYDLTPAALTLTGLILTLGIYRYRLLEIIPIARRILVENLQDAIFVLDPVDRVIDLNASASRFLGIKHNPTIGREAMQMFSNFPPLVNFIQSSSDRQELQLSTEPLVIVDARVSPLQDHTGRLTGRLLTIHDISTQKAAEKAEREQRFLAETLQESIAFVRNSLDEEDVLDQILFTLEKVVPHNMANIMMIDENGIASVVRCRGYDQEGITEKAVKAIRLAVADTYNLRWMSENGEPMLVASVGSENWFIKNGQENLRCYLGAPIRSEGKTVGFINLDSFTVKTFTQADAERLRVFASQAGLAIERARLFQREARRAEQLEILNRIGMAITSPLDLDAVLHLFHEQCALFMPIDTFVVAMYDAVTNWIDFPLFYDQGEYRKEEGRSLLQKPGLAGYVIQSRQTVYLEDMLEPEIAARFDIVRTGGRPTRSFLNVPLFLREEVIGVVSAQSYNPHAYSQDHIRLLEAVAIQAAIAIDNARLFTRAQRYISEIEALQQAALTINSSLEYERVLDMILDHLKHVLPYDSAAILLKEGEELEVVNMRGVVSGYSLGRRFSLQMPSPQQQVFKKRLPMNIPDVRVEFTAFFEGFQPEVCAWFGIPLYEREEVSGVLAVCSVKVDRFSKEDEKIAQTFANQVGLALQNSRLYSESQQRLKEQSILNEISRSLSSRLSLDELMELVYQQINRFMDARSLVIIGYNAENDECHPLFLKMGEGETMSAENQDSGSLSGYVIKERKPLLLSSQAEVQQFLQATGRKSYILPLPKSAMLVPLIAAEKVIGSMGVRNIERDGVYSQNDLSLFTNIAAQVSIYLENARLYDRMQKLATIDTLTGLLTRRQFFMLANREVERARRYKKSLAILMLDIDHFKQVNDTYGHSAGDQVLQEVALLCMQVMRRVDIIGRYGGEEFVFCLPEASLASAVGAAERLRKLIAEAEINTSQGAVRIRVSLGVAGLNSRYNELETLLECADRALYAAKRQGRDRVEIFKEENIPEDGER